MHLTLRPSRACIVVHHAPSHAMRTSGVVFGRHVQLQNRAKKGQKKRHPSRTCMRANSSFPGEVKPSCGRGLSIDHMLWGEGYSILKRGACCACVKMGFYGKRGVFWCFLKNRNTFSGPGYVKCPKLIRVIFMTYARFFESVLVSNSSWFATTDP